MLIAVVEDDEMLQEELVHLLTKTGYDPYPIKDFTRDIAIQIETVAPDLILLDINLPNQSGFEICRAIKSKNNTPILVLTSRDQLRDELHALELGADDYLTKPFHKDRLLARIRNLLRRTEHNPKLLDAGLFQIDPQTFVLYKGEKAVVLPSNEGRILVTLVEHQNQVVTKEMLSDLLWGTTTYVDENALQVNITRLRKHLKPFNLAATVETVRGQGYRLNKGSG